jgi:hypothetical protein
MDITPACRQHHYLTHDLYQSIDKVHRNGLWSAYRAARKSIKVEL